MQKNPYKQCNPTTAYLYIANISQFTRHVLVDYINWISKINAIRHGQELIMYQQVVAITPNSKHMPYRWAQ